MEEKEQKKTKVVKAKASKKVSDKESKKVEKLNKKDETVDLNSETFAEEKQEKSTVKEVVVERKSGFNLLEVVIIMLITLFFGGLLGSGITYANQKNGKPSGKVPGDLEELVSTYNEILENYYQDLDKKELLDAGIKGMLDFLGDEHSGYLDQEQSDEFNEKVKGKYVGIGVEIERLSDGGIKLLKPFENGPADKAGLKDGDRLLKVNGKSVEDLTLTQISSQIKGKAGTKAKITILRGEEEKEVELTREEVAIPSVRSAIFPSNEKKVGYLQITIFAENTYDQFKKELEFLEKQDIDSLILDVRGNSGGYLEVVENMLSLFMDKTKIIYQLDTKGIVQNIYSKTNEKRTYPVAVLINKNSASASEILAAAMLESYGAEVVGVSSYGKGTVQRAHELTSGATIKFTIQKWLTPKGNWINETGVTPTKEVVMDAAYGESPSNDTDNQLQEAIRLLSSKE